MAHAQQHNYLPAYNGPEGQEDMPWLLTAGPVITPRDVKLAMLADWSVRDSEFISLTFRVSEQLLELVNAGSEYDCIPLDVSGGAALECLLCALSPTGRKRKTLIAAHGPHATQASNILAHVKRPVQTIFGPATKPVTPNRLANILKGDKNIQTVYLVAMDVGTGIVNPVDELAQVAHEAGCKVIVDVRSSLGALPLDLSSGHIDAVIGVPWVCLEGVPGFSFIIIKQSLKNKGLMPSPSASLDLFELWNSLHKTGRFPGTPSAHAVAACSAALRVLYLEGGIELRLQRYKELHDQLLTGMRKLGFQPAIESSNNLCGYFTRFQKPADTYYTQNQFLQRLRQKGFIIWDDQDCPGETGGFRIGTIGALNDSVIQMFVQAVEKVMRDLGMRSGAPRKTG